MEESHSFNTVFFPDTIPSLLSVSLTNDDVLHCVRDDDGVLVREQPERHERRHIVLRVVGCHLQWKEKIWSVMSADLRFPWGKLRWRVEIRGLYSRKAVWGGKVWEGARINIWSMWFFRPHVIDNDQSEKNRCMIWMHDMFGFLRPALYSIPDNLTFSFIHTLPTGIDALL